MDTLKDLVIKELATQRQFRRTYLTNGLSWQIAAQDCETLRYLVAQEANKQNVDKRIVYNLRLY